MSKMISLNFSWVKAKDIILKTKTFCRNKDLVIVKEVSMDMANIMRRIILEIFPNVSWRKYSWGAEWLNSRIQRIISSSRLFKNSFYDFFIFSPVFTYFNSKC